MEIHKLYKNIFNNIVISKIIWGYVRYEGIKGDDIYKYYNQIVGSFRLFDLTVGKMLSLKMYSLFDDLCSFYFQTVINNQDRYWEFIKCMQLSKEYDIIELLRYKQLGFTRFKLFFNHFQSQFQLYNRHVLSSSASSGNLEIYNFLKNIKSFSTFKKSSDSVQNSVPNNKYELTLSLCGGQQSRIKASVDSDYIIADYECGNNIEIFNHISNSFINPTFKIEHYNNNSILKEFEILVQNPDKSCHMQFIINTFSTQILEDSNDGLIPKMILISLVYSSFELAEAIITTGLVNKTNLDVYYSGLPIGTSGTNKSIDFQILKYYWENDKREINKKLPKGHWKLFNFNFHSVNYNVDQIKECLNSFKYIPSFQEFKYLIENEIKFNKVQFNWVGLLEMITSSFNLQYLEYILEYIKQDERLNEKIILPPVCFDTRYEIVKFLFDNEINYKSIQFSRINLMDYKNKNLFFGDVDSAIEFYNQSKLKGNHNNKFYLMENGVFENAIEKGDFNFIQFLNSIDKIPKIDKLQSYYKSLPSNTYESFQIFRLLSPHSTVFQESFYFIPFLLKNPMIRHYFICIGKCNIVESICKNDIFQFKLYYKTCLNTLPDSFILDCLQESPIRILKYMMKKQIKISTLSNTGIVDGNGKKQYKSLQGYFKTQFSNRLQFIIVNDPFLIQDIDNNDIVLKIIYQSCKLKNTIYLNSILVHGEYSNEFKQFLLLKVLVISILKFETIDNQLPFWFLNLNYQIDLFQNVNINNSFFTVHVLDNIDIQLLLKNYNSFITPRIKEFGNHQPLINTINFLLKQK